MSYGDMSHVDASEPASQPVVPGILDDVQERRRRDDQCYRLIRNVWCRLGPGRGQDGLWMRRHRSITEQRARFLEDQLDHIAIDGTLIALLVDFLLGLHRHGLIRR